MIVIDVIMMYICAVFNLRVLFMAQVSMTVRMDSELKKTFDSLCAQFGMSANTAMNVFAKAVVQRRGIPFEIRANDDAESINRGIEALSEIRKLAKDGQLPNLTMDEIDGEIKLIRAERHKK